MFGFKKKSPAEKLEKKWKKALEKGRDAQRAGNIKEYARCMDEAGKLEKQLLTR